MASLLKSLTPGDHLREARKLMAFLRRDIKVQFSYRTAFAPDIFALVFQAGVFFFVQKIVDPTTLPVYGETRATYMGFVAVGIALAAFMQVGLGRIVSGIRNEQLLGTLEALFMTPTRPITIQMGLVAYDLVYVPLRTLAFLSVIALGFGVDFKTGPSLLAVAAVVVLFIPIVWGFGMVVAAWVFTFRRGGALVVLTGGLVTVGAGAYFPLTVFPDWLRRIAEHNPVAVAFEAARSGLLGGTGFEALTGPILILGIWAAFLFSFGLMAFSWAQMRERRRGTMGLY